MSRRPSALAALVFAWACGSGAHAPPEVSPERAPLTAAPLQFHLVNRLTYAPLELLKLGPRVFASGGAVFSVLGESGIQPPLPSGTGLPEDSWVPINGLAGDPDGELWATVVRTDGVQNWGELYRKPSHSWSRVGRALPKAHVYVGLTNWDGGRVLALSGSELGAERDAFFEFQLVSGPAAPLPELTVASRTSEPDDTCRGLTQLLYPSDFVALPSGDLFVVGWNCENGETLVEHFAPKQLTSRVYPISGSKGWSEQRLVALSETQVVLFASDGGTVVFAHFDGASWSSERPGLAGTFVDADVASDGTLFLVTFSRDRRSVELPGQLWWRPLGQATFSELPVPPADKPPDNWPPRYRGVSSVAALGPNDVWIVSGGSLFHTRPAPGGPITIEAVPQGPAQ